MLLAIEINRLKSAQPKKKTLLKSHSDQAQCKNKRKLLYTQENVINCFIGLICVQQLLAKFNEALFKSNYKGNCWSMIVKNLNILQNLCYFYESR